jgi:hypothetical protein
MELNGHHRETLKELILSAYREEDLSTLLFEKMEYKYNENNRGDNYTTRVFNLIQDLQSVGRLLEFIEVVRKDRPNISGELNKILSECADYPKTLLKWDEKRSELVNELLEILKQKIDKSLFFINSFILTTKYLKYLVLNDVYLDTNLKELSLKPLTDGGICPLIVCSEWCKKNFLEEFNRTRLDNCRKISEKIDAWIEKAVKYRIGVNRAKINEYMYELTGKFKELTSQKNLRIQIEIEQKKDAKNNTGLKINKFLLNINLWIEDYEFPLARFVEDQEMEFHDNFQESLQKGDILPTIIREIRSALPNRYAEGQLNIEFFLPFDFLNESLEEITFRSGINNRRQLGHEYLIFINSFERHFDPDFDEIRPNIEVYKNNLWNNTGVLDTESFYCGGDPSESDLEWITDNLAIAVWDRDSESSLCPEELNVSQWQNWPKTIYDLRRSGRKITLFWDDPYPKPSRKTRPFRTKVVE